MLVLAQRPGLNQPDPITNLALVLLIVRLQPRHPAQHLPIAMMTDESLHHHDHGLLHLVAHHFADELAAVSLILAPVLAHAAPREDVAASLRCVSRRIGRATRLNSSHLVISYAVFCLKK